MRELTHHGWSGDDGGDEWNLGVTTISNTVPRAPGVCGGQMDLKRGLGLILTPDRSRLMSGTGLEKAIDCGPYLEFTCAACASIARICRRTCIRSGARTSLEERGEKGGEHGDGAYLGAFPRCHIRRWRRSALACCCHWTVRVGIQTVGCEGKRGCGRSSAVTAIDCELLLRYVTGMWRESRWALSGQVRSVIGNQEERLR